MDLLSLLSLGFEKKASDVHLSPGLPPLLRIHGELIALSDLPSLDAKWIKQLIYNEMTIAQQQAFEMTHELDFTMSLSSAVRFRINVFQQLKGIAMVGRIIPSTIPTLDQLGLPASFKNLLTLSNGLILVTGPTGSGKSTTLAAMIDYINLTQAYHILTIEDPIEFIHLSKKSLINQRQVNRDTATFEAALRAALREDPDVILLGELRDLETMRLALTAAETGHLVISTLHTSSAPRTINRMIDIFSAEEKNRVRHLLSESLQAVICQTLVKQFSGERIAVFEIMVATPAIRHLIREDKIAQMHNVIQTNNEMGMCTLDQYLQNLVSNKMISIKVAREAAVNKELFSLS